MIFLAYFDEKLINFFENELFFRQLIFIIFNKIYARKKLTIFFNKLIFQNLHIYTNPTTSIEKKYPDRLFLKLFVCFSYVYCDAEKYFNKNVRVKNSCNSFILLCLFTVAFYFLKSFFYHF